MNLTTLSYILFACEGLAAFTSILYWKKIRSTFWKWFCFYLIFIVCSESLGHYLLYSHHNLVNLAYFNYFGIPAEFFFFFLLFRNFFKETKISWLPLLCMGVYTISWLIGALFAKWEVLFFSSSYTVGNLLLLILILSYFFQLVTSNSILNFKNNMLFWVSLGLLLYYLGTFPYYGLRNTFVKDFHDVFITYTYIEYFLNSLMYLMFTISFIWGNPNIESSSS